MQREKKVKNKLMRNINPKKVWIEDNEFGFRVNMSSQLE